MVRIKFCGVKSEADVLVMNRTMPDYVGFVFYRKSKRYVDKLQAKRLMGILDCRIIPVGVFRNEDIDSLIEIISYTGLRYVQLHGDEDYSYVERVKSVFPGIVVIKAYRKYDNCDYVIYDSPTPGGGCRFDWTSIDKDELYFLAGGINIDNIDEAVRLRPYCIDISSGIENSMGKDYDKAIEIVRRIRG